MLTARRGFTLFEVVVAALIVAILAAATVPQVMNALDQKRINDTHALLLELHYGFTNTAQTGFLNVVRTGATVSTSSTVPGRLSHLSERILSNTATVPNSCGAVYPNNTLSTSTWNSYGPFFTRVVTAGGFNTPIGLIQNTLYRTANPPTTPAWIQMRIVNVDSIDAYNLDVLIDGAATTNTGTIQYTTVSGVSTVNYLIPVVNRC